MATFGAFELPHVLKVSRMKERRVHEFPVAWSEYGYSRDLGGYARKVTISGEIRDASWEDIRVEMAGLADDTARTLDDGSGLETFQAKMLSPHFDRTVMSGTNTLPYTVDFLEVT